MARAVALQSILTGDELARIMAEMPVESPGELLREFREAGGVTLRELAQRLKMDETQLSHIEKGRRKPAPDFPAKYFTAVQAIVRERAKRVGII